MLSLLQKLLSCHCYFRVAVHVNLQTAGEVVPLVASLVELERKVFHSQEVIQGGWVGARSQCGGNGGGM
jgi:hypothetical protein